MAVTLLAPAWAWQGELRNWFGDPFFQVRAADPACPLPMGPFTDRRGRDEQAHRRAEKGTTCWLAGQCDRPKAYLYDADIAEGVKKAFAQTDRFRSSTLWVTVQGRVVYIEGCAGEGGVAAGTEALVRQVRYVDQAIAIVRKPGDKVPPYRLR